MPTAARRDASARGQLSVKIALTKLLAVVDREASAGDAVCGQYRGEVFLFL